MTAVSRSRAAGMRDQIDFGEAGLANVPVVGLDGNVMLQQGARFGPTVDPFFELALLGAEPIVDGAGTEAEQLLFQSRGQVKSFPSPGHPHRQQRLQTDRPGIACRFPDGTEHRDHLQARRSHAVCDVAVATAWVEDR